MSSAETSLPPSLARAGSAALIAGAVGLALCGLGFLVDRPQFFRSYLTGYTFWVGLALGSIPLILLHHLVGGAWGYAIRRPLEAAALTVPLMAVLFLPIALGAERLYPWADPSSEAAHSPIVQAKRAFLNLNAFHLRSVGYFAYWSILAFLLARYSRAQDRPETEPRASATLGAFSGPALLLHVFVVSFAAVDWIMSLEPEWYSTIFGPMWMAGQVFTTFAFMILVVAPRASRGPRPDLNGPDTVHDLGNLLLAFTMLWAYTQLSQFLIIWSGNLLEEIPWYLKRTRHGWQWLAVMLIIFQFILPFLVLLNREGKRRPESLARLSALIVAMNLLSTYWIVAPAFGDHEGVPKGPRPHWLDAAAVVGLGGFWIFAFLWLLGRRPLVPGNAPIVEDEGH